MLQYIFSLFRYLRLIHFPPPPPPPPAPPSSSRLANSSRTPRRAAASAHVTVCSFLLQLMTKIVKITLVTIEDVAVGMDFETCHNFTLWIALCRHPHPQPYLLSPFSIFTLPPLPPRHSPTCRTSAVRQPPPLVACIVRLAPPGRDQLVPSTPLTRPS